MMIKKYLSYIFSFSLFMLNAGGLAYADDDEKFEPAYEKESSYEIGVSKKNFLAYEGDRTYYTSGKKNGFRVNENNEESTDETVGIITFIVAPITIVYMNVVGWWE